MAKSNDAEREGTADKKKFSRRYFLAAGGIALTADALIATKPLPTHSVSNISAAAAERTSYPPSKGYLIYDSNKCAGCATCMLSCSLVHYGIQNLSLARIQIIQDSFAKFPNDVKVAPCRQCITPVCVQSCPVGAAFVDTNHGNVRRIDTQKCIGCKTCLKMCPQQPHRIVWNHFEKKCTKCDLCLDTPYWDEKGGPGGKQACVENCPMKAIKFTSLPPDQTETEGYNVNLRNEHWLNLGLVDDSTIIPPAVAQQNAQRQIMAKPESKTKE